MASGVAVHEDVVRIFGEMKVRQAGIAPQDRLKLVILHLSPDQKMIIVDETQMLRVRDFKCNNDIFKKVMSMLPLCECRYALYDCTYETKETHREEVVFIMWTPADAPLKSKMVFAASKNALKSKLQGVKTEWQITDQHEKDICELRDKLGGKDNVKTIEGNPV